MSRQSEWEKQMENADHKQAELLQFQWNLIRDQIGGLAREVAVSRRDLDTLRLAIEKEVAPRLADHRDMVSQERQAREANHNAVGGRLDILEQKIRQQVDKAKEELREDLARLSSAHETGLSGLHGQLAEHRASVAETLESARSAQDDQALKGELAAALEGLEAQLRQDLAQVTGQHQSSHSQAQALLAEHHEKLLQGLSAERASREEAHEAHRSSVAEGLEQLSTDVQRALEELRNFTDQCRERSDASCEALARALEQEGHERHRQVSGFQDRLSALEKMKRLDKQESAVMKVEFESQTRCLWDAFNSHVHPGVSQPAVAQPAVAQAPGQPRQFGTVSAVPVVYGGRDRSPAATGARSVAKARSHSAHALDVRQVVAVSPAPVSRCVGDTSATPRPIASNRGAASPVARLAPAPCMSLLGSRQGSHSVTSLANSVAQQPQSQPHQAE